MAVGEFDLIQRYFCRQSQVAGVVAGVGDDCALLQVPAGQLLAVSMDTLVEGVHFPHGANPTLVAERALRVNLSDLAAMGATPLWFTLGLTLPEANEPWLAQFAQGLWQAADAFGIALVGGDTTKGPLTITVQVHGAVPPGQALRRSGASVGDHIYVSGTPGDAAAALALIEGRLQADKAISDYLLARYYRPEPRLAMGVALRDIASAAIDVSDGLLADLGHICEQSGVGALLHLDALPKEASWHSLVSDDERLQWVLSGGDDYELCFTVPIEHTARLQALLADGHISATCIGEIISGGEVVCQRAGKPVVLQHRGYQHF